MNNEKIGEYRKLLAEHFELKYYSDRNTGRMYSPQPWADLYNDLAKMQEIT